MLFPLVARVLRLASIAICAIAILYFATFALDQTSSASSHQQAQVSAGEPSSSAPAKKSGLHEAIDQAFEKLASPFAGVVSGASGAWAVHIADTLLVLVVYGFGLGFVSRLLKLAP